MAYRRVIFQGDKVSETRDNVESFFNLDKFKNDYSGVKTTIKPSVKEDVLIVDLNGDGADSVSKKLKDIGTKHKMVVKIRNEIRLAPIKENTNSNFKPGELYKSGKQIYKVLPTPEKFKKYFGAGTLNIWVKDLTNSKGEHFIPQSSLKNYELLKEEKNSFHSSQQASNENIESIRKKLEKFKEKFPNWKFNVTKINGDKHFDNSISFSSTNSTDDENDKINKLMEKVFPNTLKEENLKSIGSQLKIGFHFSNLSKGDFIKYKDIKPCEIISVGSDSAFIKPLDKGNQIEIKSLKGFTPLKVKNLGIDKWTVKEENLKLDINNGDIPNLKLDIGKITIPQDKPVYMKGHPLYKNNNGNEIPIKESIKASELKQIIKEEISNILKES